MEDPGNKPQQNSILGFIITVVVGIGLTVIAVPFLFIATCIPLVFGNTRGAIAFPVYFGLACAGSAIIAVQTRNRGVRWGAIVLFCLAVAATVWLVGPHSH